MDSSSSQPLIALVGTPNCGKTTLFNWLTGAKFRPVNYPGSTVDIFTGDTLPYYGSRFRVIDTPGTYSLNPKTQEEAVTQKVLTHGTGDALIDALVVVVDGTQLDRHLYLVQQIKETGLPFVIAITMNDLLQKDGIEINTDKLAKHFQAPVCLIDGRLGGGIDRLVKEFPALTMPTSKQKRSNQFKLWDAETQKLQMQEAFVLAKSSISNTTKDLSSLVATRKLDQWLLHPWLGPALYLFIMMTLFASIFWLATPFMDFIDELFSLAAIKASDLLGDSLISSFVSDGLIASAGAVLVFVPQIFILFLGIGALEDSGYLARAAALIDRPLSKLGMNGRAFVPLLSGFACAVPAMMAAKNVGTQRERWITTFIIPFMTCSARLPVYALLLSFLFFGQPAWMPALAMTAIYLGSALIGGVSAGLLNKILKREKGSFLMLELPMYRRPHLRVVIKNSLLRTKSYVTKAGPMIFLFALLIWTAMTFPNYKESDPTVRMESSYAGQVGQMLEPAFAPMEVDWRVGVGLLSAFAAREVFVSSLAVMFNISDDLDEAGLSQSLLEKMKSAQMPDGRPVFTFASTMGLIVFFMLALQCISTTGVAWREMGSWKFAAVQLISMNVLAYAMAIFTVKLLGAI